MERILCIVGSMNAGGAETFLMKIYRCIDREKYQMDFCVSKKEKGIYDDEIIKLGGKIFKITPKTDNIFNNLKDIKKIVKTSKYNIVLRVSQNSLSALELFAARLGGAKKIAFRSSNSKTTGGKLNTLIHYLFRPIANRISNIKIAPSKEAAIFMFGKKNYENNKVMILNNGLNYDFFKFDLKNRKEIRNELNIKTETFVIGHVGRFNFQKNHKFLIDIFYEYQLKNKNSLLLLIGQGEELNTIKEYVEKKGLSKKVKFLGIRKDVNKIYSAMDCYVFPSLFEGMPNSVLEAQANGLSCIISNTISKDVKLLNNLKFQDLKEKPSEWAKSITDLRSYSGVKEVFEKSYNIKKISQDFLKLFDIRK